MKASVITRSLVWRASILCSNFFLIILAYYHIKPASRSLFLEHFSAGSLPYVWISTAVLLGLIIGFYHRLIERMSRLNLVLGTLSLFIVILLLFYYQLDKEGKATAVAFYIFVDIFSVILVEQFWSLTNSIYKISDGKRWYGIVGTGGLIGGVIGGKLAQMWVEKMGFTTFDLLLFAVAILAVLILMNLLFARIGVYDETPTVKETADFHKGWQPLIKNRYLMLIAITLLLAQIASPLVEFIFMNMVQENYTELNQRTAYLSGFFANLGMISIAINLLVTPFVHRYFGIIAGLTLQPFFLLMSSWSFYLNPIMLMAEIIKISDRGMSYSINRASRELLYVPINSLQIYQAKAWIDMFGYRLFKVAGSMLILLLTKWLPITISTVGLSILTICICLIWLVAIYLLAQEHRHIIQTSPA